MRFLICLHINPAVLDALTDDEKTAVLDGDDRMARHHRLLSVRAHLLERAGDTEGAYDHYRRAAKATAGPAS
ncbi:hypothetical protein [Streptomyces sp. NPDC091383]|uniref:hypothetical protein n=1 Tax=Streptomyces sp. NPDC091383 TaxID=3365996 RepID=UPI0038060114